ncbi:cell filamentation protein Fic [Candidatus Roizmanbacteria bacterium CG_4_9_14_0_2_um_filter_39_13]|uniref:Cell filamentation protein Fic n=2 Tax=Candidatus Roizmaniibacteriota TaxID=1752723 RepID=A0A2M8EZH9_9BACT|nr:MAG: cell filamentation protein Fic [Candidatus Roizmanbacteria bacterium CG_4_10_14_0_2_um_filter_39_12]PJC32451.1 MAG: cell filamentation protein Fic [Candidatus Roizmanbacteria bacterium CG_4_9_14_0_2_um_filter_39_13]PJE61608.1 MAG: cell filamentation protein Fic [Candidatus Roizmanbacteria bacterium CG10_big_fil_rev_8_21_14_0_10_39_12]
MKKNNQIVKQDGFKEFLIYTTPNGKVKIEIFLHNGNIWLTQAKIANLFGVQQPAIAKHLKNIFETRELEENSVHSILEYTATDGKTYKTKFYNLDAIISVGYRVNSTQATHFRIWATEHLKEYIIKGFTMDDERLKQGERVFGKDYFRELLERIRSIRASERRIYLQITDIFSECSIDYNPDSQTTKDFFATVQNMFHFAITGQTAAEIIYEKVDKNKPFMGLTTWKHSPSGRILLSDVTIAKNYLSEKEIKKLERTISGFFDYIENLIENRQAFTMAEFAEGVNKFLSFNEYKILAGKGKISHTQAENKALAEYAGFNKSQSIESDFDREVKKLLKKNRNETHD